MIKKWSIRYPAVGGEEERRAYVYLPTMYDADPGRRYPVLYMFDGQNVFFDEDATYGKSWGVADYLDYTDTPLIVAAVECNAGANNERLVEYSPYRFDDKQYGHFDGKGKDTLNWFVHEFKPFIDANYRTQPDRAHTFIGGSSMGGLMSLYALLQYSDVFGRAAALSPLAVGGPRGPDGAGGPLQAGPGHGALHGLRLQGDGKPRRDAEGLRRDVQPDLCPRHQPDGPRRARRKPQRGQLGKAAALRVPHADVRAVI